MLFRKKKKLAAEVESTAARDEAREKYIAELKSIPVQVVYVSLRDNCILPGEDGREHRTCRHRFGPKGRDLMFYHVVEENPFYYTRLYHVFTDEWELLHWDKREWWQGQAQYQTMPEADIVRIINQSLLWLEEHPNEKVEHSKSWWTRFLSYKRPDEGEEPTEEKRRGRKPK